MTGTNRHCQLGNWCLPDEVLGLHWSALDWRAGTLRVTHSVRRVKERDESSDRRTRVVVTELKTPKSRRILALTPARRMRAADGMAVRRCRHRIRRRLHERHLLSPGRQRTLRPARPDPGRCAPPGQPQPDRQLVPADVTAPCPVPGPSPEPGRGKTASKQCLNIR